MRNWESKEIRSIWNKDEEDYYFSVVDVVGALKDSSKPRDYWYRLNKRMD